MLADLELAKTGFFGYFTQKHFRGDPIRQGAPAPMKLRPAEAGGEDTIQIGYTQTLTVVKVGSFASVKNL